MESIDLNDFEAEIDALLSECVFNEGHVQLDETPADLQHYQVVPSCKNCGANDWDITRDNAFVVCYSCGLCVPGLLAVSVPDRDGFHDTQANLHQLMATDVRSDAFFPSSYHNRLVAGPKQYKRTTYLSEKFRHWRAADSPIDERDWTSIIDGYYVWKSKLPRKGLYFIKDKCTTIDKGAVQSILSYGDALNSYDKKDYLKRKYLEKWRLIKYHLTGQKPKDGLLEDFAEYIYDAFHVLEKAFPHISLANRSSFPHYDTVVTRLMELKGKGELASECEQLKSPKARKKFEIMWWRLCKYLQWPYISRDAHILTRTIKKRNLLYNECGTT